jgi:hypothetical protein
MRTGILMFMASACIWPARGQDQPKPITAKPSAKEMFLTRQFIPNDPDEPQKPPAKTTSHKPTSQQSDAARDHTQTRQKVPIVQAAYTAVPLGLRYTVQKTDGEHTTDVRADTTFHSGDHIQLRLEVNDTGYLYVVSQGSSRKWRALYPSSEINSDNRVQRGQAYTVPPGTKAITFVETPGVEHLFVILSRQPVQEIDSLIPSLKDGRQTPASDTGRERPNADTLMASARPIDDGEIAAIRATYTRDLIIEDLGQEPSGQEQAGQQQDKSVYVVNPKGSKDSRVVADILLNHQK